MTIKQLVVIVDDFTSNSVSRYSNVTYYDYGISNVIREWDYFLTNNFLYDGYGDVDYSESLFSDYYGFHRVTYENSLSWRTGIDITKLNSGTGIGFGGYTSFFNDYLVQKAIDSSINDTLQHGDWVLSRP